MAEPSTNDVGKSIRVTFDDELARSLEDWRRRQPTIPTVSEGVRRLVARALANENVAA
jgi:hypothetical protein